MNEFTFEPLSLYYTTDGSHLHLGSTWYSQPFWIDEYTVLKVVAYTGSTPRSEVAIAKFEFPHIAIHPNDLPDAVVGVSYSQTLSATGGTAAYTFSISAGSLPLGLGLSSSVRSAQRPSPERRHLHLHGRCGGQRRLRG